MGHYHYPQVPTVARHPQQSENPGQSQRSVNIIINQMNNLNRRGPWSSEEDQKLMEMISIFGPTNWVRISNNLVTRTPKQCRERYHQNLKPSLNRTPISQEEGELIEQLVLKYGKKWAEIARHLNGRSDNAIKNWWNGGASKRRRASLQMDKVNYDDDLSNGTSHQNNNLHTFNHANNQIYIGPYQHGGTSVPGTLPNHIGNGNLGSNGANAYGSIRSHDQLTLNNSSPVPANTINSGSTQNSNGISFNTTMFNSSPAEIRPTEVSPLEKTTFAKTNNTSRSASFDYSNQLPPLLNKRRLFEDPLSLRRHSINNTNIYNHTNHLNVYNNMAINSSHPNLSSSSITSSNGVSSPLYSTNNSRNNSITMDTMNFHSNSTSNVNSRRSSIAPDLFPNPLTHKRNVSLNSIKMIPLNSQPSLPSPGQLTNAPSFHTTPLTFNSLPISLTPEGNGNGTGTITSKNSNSNLSNVLSVSDKKDFENKTKIKVSSLID